MSLSRRDLLLRAIYGTGLIGLRSLATGIPAAFFLNPRKAVAQQIGPNNHNAQYVIMSTSAAGDPINANAPGMYATGLNIVHSPDPAMAATPLTLGSTATSAALPWSTLPQTVLDRACFFNHGTYTVVHPDESNVLKLMNSATDMFPSLLAKQLGPQLGTIQVQPLRLGQEVIDFAGSPQPSLSPVALAKTLISPNNPLGNLQSMRDKYLDQINAIVRSQGNPAQRSFIDNYVISQRQAREISQNLLQTLSSISDNTQDSQVTAAVVMIQMNVAPVMTVNIQFGQDNHSDAGLVKETAQTIAGVATIKSLMANLASLKQSDGTSLADRVTFMTLNVFGRSLAPNGATGINIGRNHHGDHHTAVIIGKPFKAGIIGGVEYIASSHDYRATSIQASSGAAVLNGGGDVPFGNTLTSMAATVATGVGVDSTFINQNITGGTVITPALAA